MKQGAIVAEGSPIDVVTGDLVEQVFVAPRRTRPDRRHADGRPRVRRPMRDEDGRGGRPSSACQRRDQRGSYV